jgi:hypothetical protein
MARKKLKDILANPQLQKDHHGNTWKKQPVW